MKKKLHPILTIFLTILYLIQALILKTNHRFRQSLTAKTGGQNNNLELSFEKRSVMENAEVPATQHCSIKGSPASS